MPPRDGYQNIESVVSVFDETADATPTPFSDRYATLFHNGDTDVCESLMVNCGNM